MPSKSSSFESWIQGEMLHAVLIEVIESESVTITVEVEAVIGGQPQVTRVSIEDDNDRGLGVSLSRIQRAQLGTILETAREKAAKAMPTRATKALIKHREEMKYLAPKNWDYPATKGHPDENLAAVAYWYARFVEQGIQHPINLLSTFMQCSKSAAASRVAAARERGFLTAPDSIGQAGGEITPEVLKVLGIKTSKSKKGNAKKGERNA